MTVFETTATLLTGAALAAYVNHRFLRLPSSIGLMLFALLLSLVGIGLGQLGFVQTAPVSDFVNRIDFSALFLQGMLCVMLFAGALHIDLDELRSVRGGVLVLATAGVLLSTLIIGTLTYFAAQWIGLELPYIYALLFGALISPTDPIAVLALLRGTGITPRFYTKIGGESLFNDGAGIAVFMALLGAAQLPNPDLMNPGPILREMVASGLGGAALGLLLGFVAFWLMRRVNDYKVEVLLTLALATGSYALALVLHLSAPIAVAAAGLVIGYHGRRRKLQPDRQHLDMFWELLDEVMNAILFILIGLVLMIVPFDTKIILLGVMAVIICLFGRFVSVGLPVTLMRLMRPVAPKTVRLLTWGGLRGGISLALVLALPPVAEKPLLLAITYVVVVFSIMVQGLSFRAVAQRLFRANAVQATITTN
jgi:CPA1 family monovalent cation:H+ antiporter